MAAMGPFYCPLDRKVYIALSFYRELSTRFRAPGDFAQAYVIAHEVGHRIQTLFGIAVKVQRARAGTRERDANALQMRMELRTDCFAGVWAKHANRAKNILEPGDIDEALNAASAIGDDRIQKQTQGHVPKATWCPTRSPTAPRRSARWFRNGFESGDLQACDTFNAERIRCVTGRCAARFGRNAGARNPAIRNMRMSSRSRRGFPPNRTCCEDFY